jgi:predicted nucleotidyltransferase
MDASRVLGIAEARASLSALVDSMSSGSSQVAIIGSHRKPEAAIIPYSTYLELKHNAANPKEKMNLDAIKSRADLIRRLGASWGMSSIAVFGSMARGEEKPDSDIDFLVDAEPGRSYFDLAGFGIDLEQLLGRPVDVVSRDGLDAKKPSDKSMLDDAVLL